MKLKDSTIEKLFESLVGFKEVNIVRDPYTKFISIFIKCN